MSNIGHWFKHKKARLYIRHLQAEQMHTVGWLLYSMSSMDTKILQKELEKELGFPIHARWQMINTGNNKDMREEDKIRAIHLRVDESLQDEAVSILGELYSSSAETFPLGHCMRLIPPVDRMMNPTNISRFEELRHRQRNFEATMTRIQSWEIASLYTESSYVTTHLHHRIMQIKSPNFKKNSLFHCVDKPSERAPCIFHCHPSDETHA